MNRNVEQWQVRKPAVVSERGVVAAQHWLAASAGAGILAQGGNAVDAAVACAFALGATEPWMCGLGGSGYLVVWLAETKTAHVIDFQGVLARAIDPADYPLDPRVPDSIMGFPGVVDNRNVAGYGSITLPGAVAGLSQAVGRFGRLSLDTVMTPAIDLADRGLPVDWHATLQIALAMDLLRNDPAAADIYLPKGVPARPEQYLPLGKLAETLRRVAEHGPDGFYQGPIAESMAADLARGGSPITVEDFAAYDAVLHATLVGEHRGATLHTAGETSGGPRLIEALAYVAEHLAPGGQVGAQTWRAYAGGLDRAFRSHKQRLGRAPEGGCTSHMSAVDTEGNMAALTYTLLNRFGSGVVLPGTGILMNNAVSYFDPRPGLPTTMAGGKRINASNMCPTIAVRDGQALFAVGASGANHIVPCTMQITGLLLDDGLTLEQAFHAPRIDASDRGNIRVNPAAGEAVIADLGRDHDLEIAQLLVYPKLYSCPSGVLRDPETGLNHAMSDPSNPVAGAAAEAPFEVTRHSHQAEVRA
jgi:gamma-glutamyltranspeptidase/glutathione hydrolase